MMDKSKKLTCYFLVLVGLYVLCANAFSGKAVTNAVLQNKKMSKINFEQLVTIHLDDTRDLEKALRNATNHNLTEHMTVLLQKNVDINAVGGDGLPAIYRAISKGHLDAVKILALRNVRTDLPNEKTIITLIMQVEPVSNRQTIFQMLKHRLSTWQINFYSSVIDNNDTKGVMECKLNNIRPDMYKLLLELSNNDKLSATQKAMSVEYLFMQNGITLPPNMVQQFFQYTAGIVTKNTSNNVHYKD